MSAPDLDLDALEVAAGMWGSWVGSAEIAPLDASVGSELFDFLVQVGAYVSAVKPERVLALIGRLRQLEESALIAEAVKAERRERSEAQGRPSVVTLDIEVIDQWLDAIHDMDIDDAFGFLDSEFRSVGGRES